MTDTRARRAWDEFRDSRFLPATVLVLILSCAATQFVASYTYAAANDKPENIPIVVVGTLAPSAAAALEPELEGALGGSLQVQHVDDRSQAVEMINEQEVFAIIETRSGSTHLALDVSGASGQTVATLLEESMPPVLQKAGFTVTVTDIKPLQDGDPHGLTIFYMTLASVIVGFVGDVQLGVHARSLRPWERIGFTAAYSIFGGFGMAAVVDWLLGALDLPFVESWFILTLTLFTCGMVFTMFSSLFGRWVMIPTWLVMVLLGNPSSGGAVSWPLLPRLLATIGGWLPPGASVNAQHTAVYFPDHQYVWPFLVLAGWSVIGCAVYLWRSRPAR